MTSFVFWFQVRSRANSSNRVVGGEAMVGASRQRDQIASTHTHAHPFVLGISDVKVARAVQTQADLVVGMQVLRVEYFQLFQV
jgi:hypothetical protein